MNVTRRAAPTPIGVASFPSSESRSFRRVIVAMEESSRRMDALPD
jgi:hypothetical protein